MKSFGKSERKYNTMSYLQFPTGLIAVAALLIAIFFVFIFLIKTQRRAPIAEILATPLMNKSEHHLYHQLGEIVSKYFPPGHEVMSQVSYGEFLKCKDFKVRSTFNSKRADFLVIDQDTNPVVVVEYQGSGHFGRSEKSRDNAMKRDRVKRQTLASAGIPMIEVPAKFSNSQLRELFENIMLEKNSMELDHRNLTGSAS